MGRFEGSIATGLTATGTRTYVNASNTDHPNLILRDLITLEMRANALGLYPAARALNNAKNAIGWQLAGDIGKADAASTHRL